VTPPRFHEQLRGLLTLGYQPWPLRKVLDLSRAGQPIPTRTFVVTFDDGYENVYRQAWPILRELGVAGTVFLATAYLDSTAPFPFETWSAAGSSDVSIESWKPLTYEQCAEMLSSGLIELGCHTHTHAFFRDRPDAFCEDMSRSVEVLSRRFGVTEPTFSFPFGLAGPALVAAARRAGVQCALTTQPVLVRPGSDPFTWGRFTVEETDTAATLAAKLDGWYSLARGAWLQLRGPVTADEQIPDGSPVCPAVEGTDAGIR
jgi:peptidoglycan/xylan/chitin deacetylase (PgdA/CDA1 family)